MDTSALLKKLTLTLRRKEIDMEELLAPYGGDSDNVKEGTDDFRRFLWQKCEMETLEYVIGLIK